MNREYLFRGKTIETHKWIYGGIVIMDGRYFIIKTITYPVDGSCSWGAYEVDPETVGQWTGLIDKNKVKVFEGDVFKGEELGEFEVVVYHNSGFAVNSYGYYGCMMPYGWDETAGGFGAVDTYYLDELCIDELEVIANVHDSYEILKGCF